MTNQTCETCTYAQELGERRVQCRRYAPRPVVVPEDTAIRGAEWPELSFYDWCGEWEPKLAES